MRDDADGESIVVQVDYAENFVTEEQDTVQSAHRSTKPISILTAYTWCGPLNFSSAMPSDNVSHNKSCINICLDYIIGELKQYLSDLETVITFSDGAASQFKQ